ncbi:thioredoxin family protein [Sedimenticola hydrogenitrophicus]|uniref:thioredoxin family protein n=1 Tax=Sedimenticola hydrogenitrophicus TaxID=2967975 RepID=UPI0021A31C8D|nr:thioredoxin fold domain-containing protein [Sedimenticola hydrogenitrophicus]
MRNRLFGIIGLVCCALLNLQTAAAQTGQLTGGAQIQHPDWFKNSFLDVASDVDEAAAAGRHVILFMYLNECPYCARMADENFANAPYTPFIRENFDVIEINIRGDREVAFDTETSVTEKELARLLKVRYTPTILFLNKENQTVLRLNGYRSVPAFKHALDFVQQQAYLNTTLSRFIEQQQSAPVYRFRDHPMLRQISDLQSVAERPLAVLFEDSSCDACDDLHDGHLRDPKTLKILENFTLVRLNANADDPIVDPTGNPTTPRAFAEQLGLTYRPGIVLFDRGKEISRIDGLLYSYHFQEMLRYVGERHYEQYPNSFYDYLNVRTAEILESGRNIDLSK